MSSVYCRMQLLSLAALIVTAASAPISPQKVTIVTHLFLKLPFPFSLCKRLVFPKSVGSKTVQDFCQSLGLLCLRGMAGYVAT